MHRLLLLLLLLLLAPRQLPMTMLGTPHRTRVLQTPHHYYPHDMEV
jgi:hypothetical protein